MSAEMPLLAGTTLPGDMPVWMPRTLQWLASCRSIPLSVPRWHFQRFLIYGWTQASPFDIPVEQHGVGFQKEYCWAAASAVQLFLFVYMVASHHNWGGAASVHFRHTSSFGLLISMWLSDKLFHITLMGHDLHFKWRNSGEYHDFVLGNSRPTMKAECCPPF